MTWQARHLRDNTIAATGDTHTACFEALKFAVGDIVAQTGHSKGHYLVAVKLPNGQNHAYAIEREGDAPSGQPITVATKPMFISVEQMEQQASREEDRTCNLRLARVQEVDGAGKEKRAKQVRWWLRVVDITPPDHPPRYAYFIDIRKPRKITRREAQEYIDLEWLYRD